MNWYFVIAAALAFLVGLVHSVLGERLIFRRLRQDGFVPTNGGKLLGERDVRILWASWHVLPFSVGVSPPFCCGCHFLRQAQARLGLSSKQLLSPCLPGQRWCLSAQRQGTLVGRAYSQLQFSCGSVVSASEMQHLPPNTNV